MTRGRANRLTRLALSLAFVSIAWVMLASAPAPAIVTHRLAATFNGADAPGGPFGVLVTSDAVDQANGDVYVTEANAFELGKGVIDKFDEHGVYAGVQITGAETPQGSFALGLGSGVAVDNSLGAGNGDVYVADTEHGVVDRFSSTGVYLCQITGGATPSASECNGPAGSDTPSGSIIPAGVAVDSSGDLYVADNAHAVIDEFGPAGAYIGQIADPHLSTEMFEIALDGSGDLYVTNGGANVVKFDAAGAFVSVFDDNHPTSVAVDPATDRVYVFDGGEPGSGRPPMIAEYDSVGNQLGTFRGGKSESGLDFGLAVDGSHGDVYAPQASFSGGDVLIFGPDVVIPTVSDGAATGIQETGATLHGHVDPDTAHGGGEVTECVFEYGTSTSYGQSAPCAPVAPYASATDVSANVALTPSTTYHFRVKATDVGGANEGADEVLTTPGPAGIEGEDATAYAKRASVRATIDPYGFATFCEAQYVDAASFKASGYAGATTVPCSPSELAAGFAGTSASASFTGLRVGTTYHYRFVTTNGSKAKTTDGADETFATFGIQSFAMEAVDSEGKPYTQAGGHPYALITSFKFNTTRVPGGREHELQTTADPRDIVTALPPGLIGNATVLPRCTPGQLAAEDCSGATQVGVLQVLQEGYQPMEHTPLYNIVPPANTPVELGANIAEHTIVYITANVRTGGDYGVTAVVKNASTDVGVTGSIVELWGVPADPSHDAMRACPAPGHTVEQSPCSAGAEPVPFLSNPTSCAGPLAAKLRVDSWQAAGEFVEAASTMPPTTGCDKLSFDPSISVLPDTSAADSPSGVLVKLHVPQNESKTGLIAPSLQDAVVTLPAGVTLNPAAANGLQSCSEAQFAPHDANPPECPDSSKVGSIEIETPLLPDRMVGSAYLAAQDNNPFKSTFALYVAAQGDGALVKVAGKVEPDPLTGQLVSSFSENPEVPFSDFRLHFFGGPRAPLATPKLCGTYTSTAVLTPWSAPGSGPAPEPSIPFNISTGPGGAPCATPGFAPTFTAGTTSNQAGGFTPFTLTMGRNDGEQNLGGITTVLPPGLTGALSNVPLCGKPQASEGTCPAASQVGHVTTGVGAGPFPLFVPGPGTGEDPVYLTGPYKGAPFGLSIVVPAEAGPFNLDENGRPVVVRAKVSIDPTTAQVTVTSDPVPQILKGVPLDIRAVNVAIDRSGFMINPTSCEPMRVEANLTSGLGTPATLSAPLQANASVPFQVTNCAALAFKPHLSASTSGHPSRADGTSFNVKLGYEAGPHNANIARVKVELPRGLPSRLATLQKACVAAVFNANPAGCPAASIIGHATATTPVLPVPLTGPVYFVSNGGEAFPNLVIVLQGYGVTVHLVGDTFISKAGITSSTFKTVPDVPVGSFELNLPQGPGSALTANGNPCRQKLAMPTEFAAQNGVVIKTSTKIAVTGCPKHRVVHKHSTGRHGRRRSGGQSRRHRSRNG